MSPWMKSTYRPTNSKMFIKKYYRIERKEICFLKFIFEAYDGIAMLTTVDSDLGVVMFHIAPGCEDDVEMILQDLQHHIMIEEVL